MCAVSEPVHGGVALRDHFVGVAVFQLAEVKSAALLNREALLDPLGVVWKTPEHLFARLQVSFAVGFELPPSSVQCAVVSDAFQHVLERLAIGGVLQCTRGDHNRKIQSL